MEDYNNKTPTSGTDPKVVGIVAYITLVGTLVALVLNNPKSDFGSFHVRQALGNFLLLLASRFLIPVLGWIAGSAGLLLGFVLWVLGIISAAQGEKKPVPLLGVQFQDWFKTL